MSEPASNVDIAAKRSQDEVVEVVYGVLVERHPALVAYEELLAELVIVGDDRAAVEVMVEDAVDELCRLGLAHRLEGFAFASHTAIRARRLG